MDIEWAHAMAPGASIDVLNAVPDFANYYEDIPQGMATLAGLPGVSVVSASYGSPLESLAPTGLEQQWDSTILGPAIAAHPNVSFFASSGDSGASDGLIYPSASPSVVSVGGTTLNLTASNQWLSETGWSYSGGGISNTFPEPA